MQPTTMWPKAPDLHSNIFFYVNLFATIILSWNSLKCILWYLLELSDPFIKNKNRLLLILILREKLGTKNLLLSLENEVYFFFFKKGNAIFRLNLDKEYRNHFLNFIQKIKKISFHTFWTKDVWLKASNSLTLLSYDV